MLQNTKWKGEVDDEMGKMRKWSWPTQSTTVQLGGTEEIHAKRKQPGQLASGPRIEPKTS
jgi:hypothetical protein